MCTSQVTIKLTRIKLVGNILVIGFLLSLFVNIVIGNLTSAGYPFNTFFFRPETKFSDFKLPYLIARDPYTQLSDRSKLIRNPLEMPDIIKGEYWEINRLGPVYFPFAYWLVLPFTIFSPIPALFTFLLLNLYSFTFIWFREVHKIAGRSKALILSLLSYPLLILLNRGNFELFTFVFLYIFFIYYDQESWRSTILLACAIAMKFIPIGYLLIPLSDKKYRQLLFALLIAALLNIAGYALYPGSLIANMNAHLQNLRISSFFYGLDGRDLAFNNSISAGIKYLVLLLHPNIDLETLWLHTADAIQFSNVIVLVNIVIWSIFIENERWKKILIVTCGILLIPSSSADYRLILIYIPFFMWLKSPVTSPFDKVYALFFGLLFIPKSYFHIPSYPEISIATLINPLSMIGLMAVVVTEKLFSNKKNMTIGLQIRPQKYLLLTCMFFILPIAGIILVKNITISQKQVPVVNPDTINYLKLYSYQAERNNNELAAIGYFSQWMIVEPQNPEPRIGLARSYTMVERYWESFKEYVKVLNMPNLSIDQEKRALLGFKQSYYDTVCDFQRIKRNKWNLLIQAEYESLIPSEKSTSTVEYNLMNNCHP